MGTVNLDLEYFGERGAPGNNSLLEFVIMNDSSLVTASVLLVEREGDFVQRERFVTAGEEKSD